MRLGSVRDLMGITPVLMDPEAKGPDPVYYMFYDVSPKSWANITVMTPGQYGSEFPKTFGHYHGTTSLETYHVISGSGILQLQKKFMEQKMWVPERVEEVFLVTVNPGEEIVIRPEYGHSWSNVGEMPFITYDNWRDGHQPADYVMVERQQGLAYYLTRDESGKVKAVANPKYQQLPEPIWLTAAEFKERGEKK